MIENDEHTLSNDDATPLHEDVELSALARDDAHDHESLIAIAAHIMIKKRSNAV